MHPIELRNDLAAGVLSIVWEEGDVQSLKHRNLRMDCPCAECKQSRRQGNVDILASADARIAEIRLIGSYAAQFIFSDGHERGIFPWPFLRGMSTE